MTQMKETVFWSQKKYTLMFSIDDIITTDGYLSFCRDNDISYVKTDYDIYDRKISVSEPYANLSGAPTQVNTSSFDNYGRLVQTVAYTGKTTNISYSGLTSTMNDGFKTVATTKNAADLTVSMTDDGGTINYQHYPNGNLKSEIIILNDLLNCKDYYENGMFKFVGTKKDDKYYDGILFNENGDINKIYHIGYNSSGNL